MLFFMCYLILTQAEFRLHGERHSKDPGRTGENRATLQKACVRC